MAQQSLISESEAEYREQAKTHLTSHAPGDFRRCPLLYWKRQQGLVSYEDRPAYLLGRAASSIVVLDLDVRPSWDGPQVARSMGPLSHPDQYGNTIWRD